MGFLSFNKKYYRERLEKLENKKLTHDDIYEAQQLLKVLDDLADEGYTNLNYQMENEFFCLTRLRALLKKANASPFVIDHEKPLTDNYSIKEYELNNLIDQIISDTKKTNEISNNIFLEEILNYIQWLGYKENTAYIFLLRDSLLPYIYYKTRNYKKIYPWLISRHFLENITNIKNIDDDIRLPIYEALETGCVQYDDFCDFCSKKIISVLDKHLKLKQALLDLLERIKEQKITVIESGYMGTIPMMLRALDKRISFTLYTTAPFLYKTYKNYIYCRKYENLRSFETLYSQDLLLRYFSYYDGKFYVNISADENIKNKALQEIKFFMI